MADETTHFILGDAAADAVGQPRKRRFFGRRRKERQRLTHCENCGAPLAGEYCARCGQHAIDYRRSLLRVLIDAADSFLNWDTKFLKSVGVLLIRPWRLTNDFNAGRRVRYVHPLRLYLLASIAFFLIAKLLNFTPHSEVNLTPEDRAEVDAALVKLTAPDSPLTPEQRAKIEAVRGRFMNADASLTPEQRALTDKVVTRLPRFAEKKHLKPKDIARLDTLLNRAIEQPAPPPVPDGSLPDGVAPPVTPAAPGAAVSPSPKPKSVIQFDDDDEANSPFGKWLQARVKKKIGEDGTNAQLFLETLRSHVPTMMLACVPLFAFVLKVLYIRQRRFYVEHLVYALHIHTFVYVAVVVITLISLGLQRVAPAPQPVVATLLSLVVAALVFVSIRRVYRQGWFITVFKFVVGGVAYLTVLVMALVVTAFITLLLP